MVKTPKRGPIQEEELLDDSVSTRMIRDSAVIEDKIPTGEITYRSMLTDSGTETAVPDTNTELAHDLGVEPIEVNLTPQTTGVEGYVMESARSATSVTVRASVSGVDLRWALTA